MHALRVLLLAVSFATILFSCADSPERKHSEAKSSPHLTADDAVFIALPRNAFSGGEVYTDSGPSTTKLLHQAFARYSTNAVAGNTVQMFNDALAFARQSGSKYLLYPTIRRWERRAAETSANPNTVEIKLELVETHSGLVVASGIARGTSGVAAFGGQHPQDLVARPILDFVTALYR